MTGIPGSPPDLRAVPSGCAFHPRCPLAYEPCPRFVPALLPVAGGDTGQSVACHRYDPAHSEGMAPPTKAEMEERYAALSAPAEEPGRTTV